MIFSDLDKLQTTLENQNIDELDTMTQQLLEENRERIQKRSRPAGPFRSALMVSADRLRHMNKLDELTADTAVINLEDGVSDQNKPVAASLAALFLAAIPGETSSELIVRTNPPGEGAEEEIRKIAPSQPHGFRIPKIRTPEEVRYVLDLIPESIDVHLSIETGEAFARMNLLRVSPRVTAYYLGLMDLKVSLGLPDSLIHPENPMLQYLLSRFLTESRLAGVRAISFVYQDHKDEESFTAYRNMEKNMGFVGCGCISPRQVELANEIFRISESELTKAKQIISIYEQAASEGVGGIDHPELGFIDAPIYRAACMLLGKRI